METGLHGLWLCQAFRLREERAWEGKEESDRKRDGERGGRSDTDSAELRVGRRFEVF